MKLVIALLGLTFALPWIFNAALTLHHVADALAAINH